MRKFRRNFDMVSANGKVRFGYQSKRHAVEAARTIVEFNGTTQSTYVQSARTGQRTYILPKDRSSCNICGNELEGKLHCPLCGNLHSYL